MKHLALPAGIAAVACSLLAQVPPALAGPETWVSFPGSDSGPCARNAPCRTFSYALTQTDNHGTLNVLTSGDFGPINITQSVDIIAQGVEALIVNTSPCAALPTQASPAVVSLARAAICINTAVGAVVNIRGLTIDLLGNPNNPAILFASGGTLHMQNCLIRSGVYGVYFKPTGDANLYMSDCVIANHSNYAITVAPNGAANVKSVFNRIQVENNAKGITLDNNGGTGALQATIRDSVIAGNRGDGISVTKTTATGTIRAMIEHTNVSYNTIAGLRAAGGGVRAYIGGSSFIANGLGLTHGLNAVVASFGTNNIAANNTNGVPSTQVAQQ